MNVQLDSGERYLIQQIAQVVAQELREQVVKDLSQSPVLWSKKTAAYMIGGEVHHASVRYVEDLIADGQLEVFKSGLNGGGRTWIIPESVEAWKQRERLKKRGSNG